MSSSGCSLTRVELLSTVVAKSVTQNCSFLPSRGRDKLMRQLSEISLKLKPFQGSCEFTSAANQEREKAAVFLSLCNSNDLITLSIMCELLETARTTKAISWVNYTYVIFEELDTIS